MVALCLRAFETLADLLRLAVQSIPVLQLYTRRVNLYSKFEWPLLQSTVGSPNTNSFMLLRTQEFESKKHYSRIFN